MSFKPYHRLLKSESIRFKYRFFSSDMTDKIDVITQIDTTKETLARILAFAELSDEEQKEALRLVKEKK